MLFFGKREALEFIETWEDELSPEYAKAWGVFKKRRDIVAKKMGLNEKEIIFITAANLANHVIWNIKTKYNLTGDKNKLLETRGNTDALKTAAELIEVEKKYKEKCEYFIHLFDDEMNKLKNNRR